MAKATVESRVKCSLCKQTGEGVLVRVFWFIRVGLCQTCLSKLFRKLSKAV